VLARNLAAIAAALPSQSTSPVSAAIAAALPSAPAAGPSALVASYGDWTGGHLAALPRDPRVFLNGTFGPLAPMVPVPVDRPGEGEDRAGPRRFAYPVSWNLPHGVPGSEGLNLTSFATLRTVSQTYSVARACINLRIQEILAIGWDLVPTKEAEKKMRGDKDARRDFEERRVAVLRFWRRPDPAYFNFEAWLAAVLEDVLGVDALSLYICPPKARGKGVAGSTRIAQLWLVDGTTVRPLLALNGGPPPPPNPAYSQYLYGVPRVDMMTLLTGDDVKDMADAKWKDYRSDQLLYLPYVTRSYNPYGLPPIERALVPIMSGLQRQQYQLDFFSEGSVPSVFVSAGDPNATPNQCRELQDALNAMAGDPAWKHKIIVLPGNSKVDPMRPPSLADQFDDLVMTQTTMAFDVMPMELGITPRSSAQQLGAGSQMAKASEAVNQRKALKPLLKWLKAIFDVVTQDVIGATDMMHHWEGLEEGEDEAAAVEVLVQEITHGMTSIDEARMVRGHQPWGLPMTSEPVYFTATGIVPLGSIDPNTGQPKGAAPPGAPGPPGGLPGGTNGGPSSPDGGPKPTGTPAHAAAAAHETAQRQEGLASEARPDAKVDASQKMALAATAYQQRAVKASTAATTKAAVDGHHVAGTPYELSHGWVPRGLSAPDDPLDDEMAALADATKLDKPSMNPQVIEAPVVMFAALRELDLLRRRLSKGRTLDGWRREHIPLDVFTQLVADAAVDPDAAVEAARTAVKVLSPVVRRSRRDQATAAPQAAVVAGLRSLATGLADGSVSTAGFVDSAVALLHTNIREGLQLGVAHALVDVDHPVGKAMGVTLTKADDAPPHVDAMGGRFGLYAGTVAQAYETGFGLATIGASFDPDNIVVIWRAKEDACELCAARNGLHFTTGGLPGWPGDGGFGKEATICRGSIRCRCALEYLLVSPGGGPVQPTVTPPVGPAPDAATVQANTEVTRTAEVTAVREALAAPDPTAALMVVLDGLAQVRAERQRGWLMGLLKTLLAAMARGVVALWAWVNSEETTRHITKKSFDPAESRDEHGRWTVLGAVVHDLERVLGHRGMTQEQIAGSYGDVYDNHELSNGAVLEVSQDGQIHLDVPAQQAEHWHIFADGLEGDTNLPEGLDWAWDKAHDQLTGYGASDRGHRPPDPVNGLLDWRVLDDRVVGYTLDGKVRLATLNTQVRGGVTVPGTDSPSDPSMVAMEMSVDDAKALARALEEFQALDLPEDDELTGVVKAAKRRPTGKRWAPPRVMLQRHPQSWYVGRRPLAKASEHGHHVAGTPFEYSHGWVPRDPSAIFRKEMRFGGGKKIGITAHDNGDRTLDFPDGRHVRLASKDLDAGSTYEHGHMREVNPNLRSMAFHTVDWDAGSSSNGFGTVGDTIAVKKVAEPPDVDPSGEDEETWNLTPLSLHLWDDQQHQTHDDMMASPPLVELTQRDMVRLAEQARDLTAERVDTGHGAVDVFRDGGHVVLRPQAGEPWDLDVKSAKALMRAWDDLGDEETHGKRQPGETWTRVVPTNLGDLTVAETGDYEGLSFSVVGRDPIRVGAGFDHHYALWSVLGDTVGLNKTAVATLTKGAADPADPNPVEAEHVVNLMRTNFPDNALGWMRQARWVGPVLVAQDRIDTDDVDKWAATRDKARVRHFRDRISAGDLPRPVVAVQEPGDTNVKVIDGHHRTLAYRRLNRPVPAYVGFVDTDGGEWDQTHTYQRHHGDDPANKSAKGIHAAGLAVRAVDTGRVLMLQRALPEDPDDDPAGGFLEFPGGRLDDGEKPKAAAMREWAEETGCTSPDGRVTGRWTSGVYRGFVMSVPSEDDVAVYDGRDEVTNPDDPDGDQVEALIWLDPAHLDDNPTIRPELAQDLDRVHEALATAPVARLDKKVTDLSTHQADRSAPPELDDPLNAELLRLVRSLTRVDKGHPYPGQRFTHGWVRRFGPSREQIRAGVAAGLGEPTSLHGGRSARTRMFPLTNGVTVVHKEYFGDTAHREATAEYLASLVGEAVGAPVPAVLPHTSRPARPGTGMFQPDLATSSVWMGHVDGEVAAAADPALLAALVGGDDAALLGLLDVLVRNRDRHPGNLMVSDGRLVGIDHGESWGSPHRPGLFSGILDDDSPTGPGRTEEDGALARLLLAGSTPREHPFTPHDMDEVGSRLAGLADVFTQVGRSRWHQDMMARLAALAPHATGTRDLVGVGP
jgi:8-oxo-dGTP pyrophosphatase MutT (NUDIX family)